MRTEVIVIDPRQPDPATLARAAAVIRAGGLVAFPTETVYGLGANALDARAVAGIFAAKERASDDPLIVHISDRAVLDTLVTEVPPAAEALAAACWPGPLTLVLPKRPIIPDIVTAGLASVAVRMPAHPVARGVLRAAGLPIAAPSANRFMRSSSTTAAHVLEDLDGRIDLVLDGGPADAGVESTVVAIEGSQVRILRPGAVPRETLEALLARFAPPVTLATGAGPGRNASPGMMAKHYAPRARLVLHPARTTADALVATADPDITSGQVVGFLLPSGLLAAVQAWRDGLPPDVAARIALQDLGPDATTVARRLFAALRALDAANAAVIHAVALADDGLGRAVNDRLRRAAS